MSFVLEAVRDKPIGLWMMDDTSPLQDYSGYNRAGTVTGATTAVGLAAGAVFSTVVNKYIVANFDAPVFQQGKEKTPFSLEAWLYPITKTTGEVTQASRTNLMPSPSFEDSSLWASGVGTASVTTTGQFIGSKHLTIAGDGVATSIYRTSIQYQYASSPMGKTFTASMYIKCNTAGYEADVYVSQARTDGSTVIQNRGPGRVALTANVWTRVSTTFTISDSSITDWRMGSALFKTGGGAIAAGVTVDQDGVLFEEASTVNAYFDGSFPNAQWNGTANASTSTLLPISARMNLLNNPHMDVSATYPLQGNVSRQNLAWGDSSNPVGLATGTTVTPGVVADGVTWIRLAVTANSSAFRKYVSLSNLQNNRQYVASWEVYNDTASTISINVDWCDAGSTNYNIAAGQRRIVTATGSRATYDSTFRFTDLELNTLNTSVLVREIIVELGTGFNTYFDGGTTAATYNMAKGASVGAYNSDGSTAIAPSTNTCVANGSANSSVNVSDYFSTGNALQNVKVDMGSVKRIDTVKVWHFFNDGRTYHNTKTEVSEDGVTWTTVFDSAVSGEYPETSAGRTYTLAAPVYARYIRDWSNGSTANGGNHFVEVQAFCLNSSEWTHVWTGTANASVANQRGAGVQWWSLSQGGVSGNQFQLTEGGKTFARFFVPANQQAAIWRLIFGYMFASMVSAGDTVTYRMNIRGGGGYKNLTTPTASITRGDGLNGAGGIFSGVTLTPSWQEVARSMTATTKPDGTAGLYFNLPGGATTEDSWIDIEYALVGIGDSATYPTVFTGDSPGAEWSGIAGGSFARMLASEGPQQILSNSGQYDGLTMNGTKIAFGTKYLTSGEAKIEYDLQVPRAVHVFGIHSPDKNSLYVDGKLVGEVAISEDQKKDKFIATDGKLYSGTTLSSKGLMLNGVAAYSYPVPAESVARHYSAGRRNVGPAGMHTFGGIVIPVSKNMADVLVERKWNSGADWKNATLNGTVVDSDRLVPQFSNGVSVKGMWIDNCDLYDAGTANTINSVNLMWDGEGAVVEASLDNVTWETAERGKNLAIIPAGFNPTNKELLVRVSFPGGIAGDTSYVDNLTVTVFKTGVSQAPGGRTVTYTQPAYVQDNYTPIELRDDWGVKLPLSTGNVTISADTTEDARVMRTAEIWIKPLADLNTTFNVNAAQIYQNGVAASPALKTGQWVLLHLVLATDSTGILLINGPAQIGQVTIYDTALTAAQVSDIYTSYVGVPAWRVGDNSVFAVAQSPEAANIYAHNWAIESSG